MTAAQRSAHARLQATLTVRHIFKVVEHAPRPEPRRPGRVSISTIDKMRAMRERGDKIAYIAAICDVVESTVFKFTKGAK